MSKYYVVLFSIAFFLSFHLYGQVITITGKVIDEADLPLPGVNIVIKGTQIGTATDASGSFTLSASDKAVLLVTFVGYQSEEILVNNQTALQIQLKSEVRKLTELVVTALGEKREAKSLVYGTQTLAPNEMKEVRDANNILNSFQGRIANAQINQGSGGPGSSARIVLRGNRSIQGTNNALIVVDGVPINNTTASNVFSDFGGIVASDGVSNINQDDIESITILRGASAAALYGSQAGNGVIIMTTKKGTAGKMAVNIHSGFTLETPFALPAVQNKYGQGSNGVINSNVGASWGEEMKGQNYTNYLGAPSRYSPQPYNLRDFFRTGTALNNSIGISGGGEKAQTYFSYTNYQNKGILPYNDLKRHTINLRVTNQLGKQISTDVKLTYMNQAIFNRAKTGETGAPVLAAYQMPRSMSTNDVSQFETSVDGIPTRNNYPATLASIYQNGYWLLNRTHINEFRNRIIGNASLAYQLTGWLEIKGRATLDRIDDRLVQQLSQGTLEISGLPGGQLIETQNASVQQWYDVIFSGLNKISPRFKIRYQTGAIFQDVSFNSLTATANGLNIPNMFSLGFASSPQTSQSFTQTQTQSIFGQSTLSFKDAIFLEGSFRNEWDSRLPKPYTIFYPSIGTSILVSSLATLPKSISFLKVNANYAKVGNGGQAQLLSNYHNYSSGAGKGFLARNPTQAIAGLKPEIVTNFEIGLELRLIKDRIGVSAAYYKNNSTNQLLTLSQPVATGFNSKYINAGNIENKGFEIILNLVPIETSKFNWESNLNFSKNINKIISLSPEIQYSVLGGGFARSATPIVQTGGQYGDILGFRWKSHPDGSLLLNSGGLPVATSEQVLIGNFNPKALFGWSNTFTYNRMTVRMLIDGRLGGLLVDGTEMNLAFSGITRATQYNREGGWILPGKDAAGNKVEKPITAQQFWQAGATSTTGLRYGVADLFAYDATNFRLRELSLGYTFPIHNDKVIKSAKISVVGRNLMWLYRGYALVDIPGIPKRKMSMDPSMSLGSDNYQGIQYGTMPSTGSYGFDVQLTF